MSLRRSATAPNIRAAVVTIETMEHQEAVYWGGVAQIRCRTQPRALTTVGIFLTDAPSPERGTRTIAANGREKEYHADRT